MFSYHFSLLSAVYILMHLLKPNYSGKRWQILCKMQNSVNKQPCGTNPFTYLIGPNTLRSSKSSDAPAHLHVLVSGVHLTKAFTYVWHHPPQNLPAEYHSWPSHAEILSRLKSQLPKFFNVTQTSLSQIQRLTAVQ